MHRSESTSVTEYPPTPAPSRVRYIHTSNPARASSNMGESVNTMRYAERAMNIQNTAVKNEDVSGPPVSYAEVRWVRGSRHSGPRRTWLRRKEFVSPDVGGWREPRVF